MTNIILFGASEFGKKIFEYYQSKDNMNIIAFCDNDKKKHNKIFLKTKIISPENILNLNYHKIVITSIYDDEILNQLLDLGIDKDIIEISSVNRLYTQFGNETKLDMAHELLVYTCDLFNKEDIKYHLDHGTLLGIIREKTLLPWDKDIDLAMHSSQLEIIKTILSKSLVSFKSKYCTNNRWSYKVRYENAIKIDSTFTIKPITIKIFNDCDEELTNEFDLDIKFKYEYNNKVYWRVATRILSSDTNICFPTTSIEFQKVNLQIPCDTVKYLTSLYGDWKTPVKEWTYSQYKNIDKK